MSDYSRRRVSDGGSGTTMCACCAVSSLSRGSRQSTLRVLIPQTKAIIRGRHPFIAFSHIYSNPRIPFDMQPSIGHDTLMQSGPIATSQEPHPSPPPQGDRDRGDRPTLGSGPGSPRMVRQKVAKKSEPNQEKFEKMTPDDPRMTPR